MEIRFTDPVPHLRLYPILARIPGSQILWVGPEVCSRHGMMTFIHNLRGRLSFFCYREIDAITGDYVRKIKDAAVEIIRERDASCLIICTICQGAVLATDEETLKRDIEKETGVPVEYMLTNRLFMHSAQRGEINKKKPEQVLFSFLKPAERDDGFSVNILDRFFETEESDLHAFLYSAGAQTIRTLPGCRTPEEYQQMAGAHLNVITDPSMRPAAEMMEEWLGIPWADMSAVYDSAGLGAQYDQLRERIGGDRSICEHMQALVADRMEQVKGLLYGHSLQMDPMGTANARELSRWLRAEGIDVPEIRGWPGPGGPGGPGRRRPPRELSRRPPGRGRGPFGRPGMPPGPPVFGAAADTAARPVTLSACLRVLDRIIETVEEAT